jgi:hypothetical protein
VTAQSALEAARRKVHPDQLVAVMVGKEQDFDAPLTSAGLPVERVDITIPPPPSTLSVGSATPEALAKGQSWLKRACELAGGSAAWAAIKTATLEQDQDLSVQGQSISLKASQSWALPNRRAVTLQSPMGEIRQVTDGKTGWMTRGGDTQDQPQMAEGIKQEYERSLYHVLGHPEDLELQALPDPQTIDGASYSVAFVKSELVKDWTLAFGADGRLARMEYQGGGPAGPAKATQIFSDWKPEGSIQFPHSMKVLLDGKQYLEARIQSVKFNTAIPDSLFRKPGP